MTPRRKYELRLIASRVRDTERTRGRGGIHRGRSAQRSAGRAAMGAQLHAVHSLRVQWRITTSERGAPSGGAAPVLQGGRGGHSLARARAQVHDEVGSPRLSRFHSHSPPSRKTRKWIGPRSWSSGCPRWGVGSGPDGEGAGHIVPRVPSRGVTGARAPVLETRACARSMNARAGAGA